MTITQTITALPTAPDRSDSSTFSDRADAFLAALPGMVTEENTFGTQANALATTVNADKVAAAASETAAETAATEAASSANAYIWGDGGSARAFAVGETLIFTDGQAYRCLSVTSAGESPTTDPAKWQSLGVNGTLLVSSNDTTKGYLNGKLIVANHLTLTENTDGGDETLTVEGKIHTVTKTETAILTVSECTNSVISNYGQVATTTLTLPAAEIGLAFICQVGTIGSALHLKAGASDKLYLDGVGLDNGDKASLATPAIGDFITIWTVQTGASDYDWIASSGSTYWTDGGA